MYYGHIERLLFDSGLVRDSDLRPEHKTLEEKLDRHGFAHWCRAPAQNIVGAVKYRMDDGAIAYRIREAGWIGTKHLRPVDGRWVRVGNEIRFWDVPERTVDVLVKRMINCLDCGFCVVECFAARRFDRVNKRLIIDGCVQCGKCIRLKFCMGWRHRFRRRIIREVRDHE